jgi:hypothetical protein
MKHSWLVEFIHKLTWNPKKWEAANPPPLPAEDLERLVAMYPPDPPRPKYRNVRVFFSPNISEFMDRFRGLMKLRPHELMDQRVVLQLRKPGDQFGEPFFHEIGRPRVVFRDAGESQALVSFTAPPFDVCESLYATGAVVIDHAGRAAARQVAYFRGGEQFLNNGDTLFVTYDLNATDDGHGLCFCKVGRVEGETSAAPVAA